MPFVLGAKGREWAWKNKKWESLEHFNRAQRAWSMSGLVIGISSSVLFCLGLGMELYSNQTTGGDVAKVSGGSGANSASGTGGLQLASSAGVASAESASSAPGSTEVAPAPETASGANDDLLTAAMGCTTGVKCADVMLAAANPRKPDVLQAAAARMVGLETIEEGDKQAARDLNAQGLAKYSANDFAGAVDLFMQAAQANPADVEVKSNLGMAEMKVGKLDEAVTALLLALQLDPRRSNTWEPLAEALDGLKMHDEAYDALLLTYEFSSNKQHTVDFFRGRSSGDGVDDSLRTAYSRAVTTVQSGY